MSVTFGKITYQTDIMIERFRSYGIGIDQVDIQDASKLTNIVSTSVRKSIFRTVFVSVGGKPSAPVAFAPVSSVGDLIGDLLRSDVKHHPKMAASLKDYTLSPSQPTSINWMHVPHSIVKVYRNVEIKKMTDIQKPLKMGLLNFFRSSSAHVTEKTVTSTMFMRRAPSPFAEGEIRLAYHGQLAKVGRDLGKNPMVMKSFKYLGRGIHDRDQYLKQMEVSAIAHFLAKEYNKALAKPSHCLGINVLPVIVVEEVDERNELSGNRRFCAEHLLPSGGTEFTKYSNNTGYWDEDNLNETLLRFTKYTYDITDGYLMVTDLQGVHKDNTYYLTDPIILCKDILRFGNTNLGEKFMKKCIQSTSEHLKENRWW